MDNRTNIAKFVLGTAQFGLDYGIANLSGIPSRADVLSIIEIAWTRGVRHFDTAPGYGSEIFIGEFVTAHGVEREIRLTTKIPPMGATKNWRNRISWSVQNSLQDTKCDMVDVLLFHDSTDALFIKNDPDYFYTILKEWPVDQIGVSVYDPTDVEELKNIDMISAYQFPYNLLDRRFEYVELPLGTRVGRSIFLQGLLVVRDLIRPGYPRELKEIQATFHEILSRYDISPIAASLSFVKRSNFVDYFVVGVGEGEQLMVILDYLEQNSEDVEVDLSDILDEFTEEYLSYLDPRTWR